MASINDVAKRAKVAKSTVSLVLNNNGYVSDETRAKVEQAIRELDYQPSQLARNLSNMRTNLVGVVIPDVAHPFYGTFLRYAEEALYRRGYKTMVCETTERDNMEEEFLSMLRRQTMDGIIMGAHSLMQDEYARIGKPVVAFDRYLGEKIPVVRADHEAGGRVAAEKFLEKGCRNIVQVSGARIVNTPAHQYHVSFEETLKRNGIEVTDMVMSHNAFAENDFREIAVQLFEQHPGVDAVFGADMVILACLREARLREISVPGQLRMIAYDGTYVTRVGAYQPNAIVQPISSLADQCVAYIDLLIRKEVNSLPDRIFPVEYQDGDTL
ncbi:MAG: LacI family DNA-binding transcriptional regulator [Eubacteriales bacterium]|nr:LacI family DNA-binding transcriptional regulator [Eubacteriales bacterium]